VADRWPLVGRAAELAYLRALVDDGRGVVLAGAAGVGKSRLLQELIASLDGSRWHVERATGTPAAAAYPLGAFAFLDEPAGREATLLDSPLAAARRDLLSRAGDARLVLAVDNAQHLDDAWATLAVSGG
jgi:predicted ATPase